MKPFAFIARLFGHPAVTPAAIRSEMFFLGSRHRGDVLGGAIEEFNTPGLGPERSRLLGAVIGQLTRTG